MEIQICWKPFPHLKCKNGPESGIGMDCPEITNKEIEFIKKTTVLPGLCRGIISNFLIILYMSRSLKFVKTIIYY
jgi:hypothetical protein